MNIIVKAYGSAVPKKSLSNDDLAMMVDTSDEWIFSRTGIKSRHILEEGEGLSDLCVEAARKALDAAGIAAKDIGLIIAGTSTADNHFPSTACCVQAAIGAEGAAAFDLSAACSGFVYALHVADAMLRTAKYQYALVLGADALSKIVNWQDRGTCVLFGDGAGALVLEKREDEDKQGILASFIAGDGSKGECLLCPSKGEYPYITMQGQEVFKFAVRTVPESIEKVMQEAGLSKDDVKMYILHQANIRILEAVAKRLDEPMEKFPSNLERFGNTSGASIILLLDELLTEAKLVKGDTVVLCGFGAGLTWGAVAITI